MLGVEDLLEHWPRGPIYSEATPPGERIYSMTAPKSGAVTTPFEKIPQRQRNRSPSIGL